MLTLACCVNRKKQRHYDLKCIPSHNVHWYVSSHPNIIPSEAYFFFAYRSVSHFTSAKLYWDRKQNLQLLHFYTHDSRLWVCRSVEVRGPRSRWTKGNLCRGVSWDMSKITVEQWLTELVRARKKAIEVQTVAAYKRGGVQRFAYWP